MTDIIIFSGQSNMQGQTEAPMSPIPVENALEYRLLSDSLVPLAHPVGEDIGDRLLLGAHMGNGSLVPDFCRAYTAETGRKAVAVHAARGATQVHEWLPGTERFEALIKKCRGAISAAEKTDRVGKIHFVWLQGESDAIYSVDGETYGRRIVTLKSALQSCLNIDDFCMIRVGKFVNDDRDIAIIRKQEELYRQGSCVMLTRFTGHCTNDPDAWINPEANGHYNNKAMTKIGQISGKNLALHTLEQAFELEEEPYPELR